MSREYFPSRQIDLTAHQFNPALDSHLPGGVLLIDPTSQLGQKYKPFESKSFLSV
jgi:hypothetical protein